MAIKLHRDQFRWTNGRGHDQKPVLYSQKSNTYGLGKKEHNADQWWATAFDKQLKSLEIGSSSTGEVTVTQTTKNATPVGMAMTSRYYIKFVSGGILTGDVEMARAEAAAAAAAVGKTADESSAGKPRKEKKEKKSSKSSRSSRESSAARKEKKDNKKRKSEETRDERKDKRRLKRMLDKEMASLLALPIQA